jgi:hypothetical protein
MIGEPPLDAPLEDDVEEGVLDAGEEDLVVAPLGVLVAVGLDGCAVAPDDAGCDDELEELAELEL